MAKEQALAKDERSFCRLVSQAVFANPFSQEREQIDLQMAGLPKTAAKHEVLAAVFEKVTDRVRQLDQKGRIDLAGFAERDRELVRNLLLFYLFHCYAESFDRLIADQLAAGDTSVKVPFASGAISLFRRYGFSSQEALRYFSIFYQMRRAYYFIANDLVGTTACMQRLRLDLWNNVFTRDIALYEKYLWNRMEDFSTLLLGETGTGKGTAAAAIGRSGYIPFNEKTGAFEQSFTSLFISINLSQFPESLIESELFGHRKGAFTGAVDEHRGILAGCVPHSAILLDEIGEVSPPVQIKLLQVLQERTFSPVGSHKKLRFQGRVIAATNRDLQHLRPGGAFRDDFYYRLCSDTIVVPTLRQRLKEDPRELDALLSHTVQYMVGMPSPELVVMAQEVIAKRLGPDYGWPGNVRELEQCVRRVLLKHDYAGESLQVRDSLRDELPRLIETGSLDADGLLSRYCRLLYKKYGTYEEVARRTNLDRRTVKKYIETSEQ